MKTQALLASLALTLASTAFAAGDKHDHAHEHKPLHGGVVVEIKDIDYELVAKPTVIQLHLRDHGKPADVSKATAKVTLLSGTEKQRLSSSPPVTSSKQRAVLKSGQAPRPLPWFPSQGRRRLCDSASNNTQRPHQRQSVSSESVGALPLDIEVTTRFPVWT